MIRVAKLYWYVKISLFRWSMVIEICRTKSPTLTLLDFFKEEFLTLKGHWSPSFAKCELTKKGVRPYLYLFVWMLWTMEEDMVFKPYVSWCWAYSKHMVVKSWTEKTLDGGESNSNDGMTSFKMLSHTNISILCGFTIYPPHIKWVARTNVTLRTHEVMIR